MPSFPATPVLRAAAAQPRRIAFLAFDGALATDVAGPSDAFGIVNRLHEDERLPALPKPAYEIRYLSLRGGLVRASSGLILETERPSAKLLAGLDTLIVSGGSWMLETIKDQALVRWIAKAAPKARRVCSVCSGAFLLAEAGLLDGRNAATHWAMVDAFRARYPQVKLALDPIYVEDGKVWTSAGVTAGIDLALALIRRDHGAEIATRVAKQMVVFLQRPGGQAQFSAALLAQETRAAKDDPLLAITAYIAAHLDRDLSVNALAEQAGMSPRSFARLFSNGQTPAKLVEATRVEAAARALSESQASIKQIAAQCGFGDEERMRRAFLRKLGVAPNVYRARFANMG
ncbi:MAG TPA: GlxA family transcriptional regulator [Alphaproteobacteria bacterium]|nr:GlxA family transcriptional regulator [Alphaproteobacteria bacterium]